MPHFQFRSKWESLFFFVSVLWVLLFNIKAVLGKVAHKWLIKAAFTACKVHQFFTLVCLGRFIFVFPLWGLKSFLLFLFGPIKNDGVDKHLSWLTLLDVARKKKKSPPALLTPWCQGEDGVQVGEALPGLATGCSAAERLSVLWAWAAETTTFIHGSSHCPQILWFCLQWLHWFSAGFFSCLFSSFLKELRAKGWAYSLLFICWWYWRYSYLFWSPSVPVGNSNWNTR